MVLVPAYFPDRVHWATAPEGEEMNAKDLTEILQYAYKVLEVDVAFVLYGDGSGCIRHYPTVDYEKEPELFKVFNRLSKGKFKRDTEVDLCNWNGLAEMEEALKRFKQELDAMRDKK
jgi:hypothetical protein